MVTWCGSWNSPMSIHKVFKFTSSVRILLVLCRKYSFYPLGRLELLVYFIYLIF